MNRRLRNVALLVLLAFMSLTAVAVVVATTSTTGQVVVEQMRETMEATAQDAANQAHAFLQRAEDAVDLTTGLLDDPAATVAQDDVASLEPFLVQRILTSSELTGLFVGRDDGSFLFASRDGATEPDGVFVKRIDVGQDGTRTVTTSQVDADGAVVRTAEDPDDDFDPRARGWYQTADPTTTRWTEPYVFFTSGQPGLTAARALRSSPGTVVGADISLGGLSAFLYGMESSERSETLIVDATGGLLAAGPEVPVVRRDDDGALVRMTVDDVDDRLVAAATKVVVDRTGTADRQPPVDGASDDLTGDDGTNGIGLNGRSQRFDHDGAPWQVAIAEVPTGPDLMVVLIAPEDDFVADVVATQRRNAGLAGFIVLAFVLLALPVATWVGSRAHQLSHRATTDPLTGVVNRRGFEEAAATALERSATEQRPLCVALVDLDLFKEVNDTWGHAIGDRALQLVAERLRAAVREGDVVGRIGGDEFAVVLVDTPLSVGREVLERARHAIDAEPLATDQGPVRLSVTIGATERGASTELAPILERADAALYEAKDAGRNRVAVQWPEGSALA